MARGVRVLLYVDDLLISYSKKNQQDGEEVKQQLRTKYKMTGLGKAKQFLGLEITRTMDGGIQLGQQNYIKGIIKRFRMEEARGVTSSMDPNVRLEDDVCEDKPANKLLHLSTVGSLIYAALGTRHDIAFAVTALSRYNETPLTIHLTAAKGVLRYLKNTMDVKLYFPSGPTSENSLEGFTDSNWAGNQTNRKSVGGSIFLNNGSPITWQAKN